MTKYQLLIDKMSINQSGSEPTGDKVWLVSSMFKLSVEWGLRPFADIPVREVMA